MKRTRFRKSKTENFLEKFLSDYSMIEYFTRLKMVNESARSVSPASRREGRFVTLAHAREEFTAPVLTHGKSVRKGPARRASLA